MFDLHAAPIFALDAGSVMTLVFILIAALSGLSNFFGGQKKDAGRGAPNRPRRGPRPREDRLQNEIDVFLREVGGQKQQGGGEPQARRPGPPQRPRRPRPPEPTKQPVPVTRAEPPPQQTSRKPGSAIENRTAPASENLGRGLRDHHLREQREVETVAEHVQEHFAHGVQESVAEHFETEVPRPVPESASGVSPSPAVDPRSIVGMLRDRDGLRKAVLLNEILSRPRSRR